MRFYDVTSWSYVNLDDPIASSANGKQRAGVIFGTPGTAYLRYSLAVSPIVYAVFPPRLSVRIYLSSDDC